jgi:hypothetical protein
MSGPLYWLTYIKIREQNNMLVKELWSFLVCANLYHVNNKENKNMEKEEPENKETQVL